MDGFDKVEKWIRRKCRGEKSGAEMSVMLVLLEHVALCVHSKDMILIHLICSHS